MSRTRNAMVKVMLRLAELSTQPSNGNRRERAAEEASGWRKRKSGGSVRVEESLG